MGWGRTEEGGEVSEYLQHAWLKVIPNAECRETYGKVIDYRTFCTYKDGQDTCQVSVNMFLVVVTKSSKIYV